MNSAMWLSLTRAKHYSFPADRIARLAGFLAGDVVVGVNGRPISSAADIAAQLRPGTRLSFEVERGGSKVPIALNLEQ